MYHKLIWQPEYQQLKDIFEVHWVAQYIWGAFAMIFTNANFSYHGIYNLEF